MRLTSKLAVLAACLIATTSLVSCRAQSSGGGALGSAIAPRRGALFGSYEMPTPGAADRLSYQRQLAAKEQYNGRRYDIFHYFYQWSATIPSWREQWAIDGGRTPMISWAGPKVTAITSGSQDRLIDQRARALKALGKPVLLRFFWEMDGTWTRDRAIGPDQFKAAWRHLHRRFQAAGATNVEFVWAPTAYGFDSGEAPKWYPGDDTVDWIAADGYNWYPKSNNSNITWRPFSAIFAKFYEWAKKRPKPLMIAEVGLQEDPARPGRKAAWLKESAVVMEHYFPRIKAVVYFNGNGGRQYPWPVESSTSAKSAWRSVGQKSYMRTR